MSEEKVPDYVAHWNRVPTKEEAAALQDIVVTAYNLMERQERILRVCDELEAAEVPASAVEPIRDFADSLLKRADHA